jgi:catechol 2,3-dioxygenase-like lactoylglutathione lyase family enzyme
MYFTKFDFMTVWVKEEARQTNIDWYVNHLGLTIGWDSPGEKLTLLNFPNKQAMTLLAHYPEHVKLPDGEVKVCLTTDDLQGTKSYLEDQNIQTTVIYRTPWGTDAFDFFDPQGTRFTATSSINQAKPLQHVHRFTSYFLHIAVSDLLVARHWYAKFLGLTPSELNDSREYLRMKMPEDEQVPFPLFLSVSNNFAKLTDLKKPVVTAIRPFFQLAGKAQLEQTHQIFAQFQIEITAISGNHDDFMRWFDFADPDGNQLHAIAY